MKKILEKIISRLLFVYFVLFPFGQLTRVPGFFVSPEIHFYLTDIVLLGLLVAWGIWRFFLVKKRYCSPPLAVPVFCFVMVCLISLGWASPLLKSRGLTVAGLYLGRWVVYAGLYFALFDLKGHFKWLTRENLINFLIGLGVMMAIFGLVQYLLWPNLRLMEVWGWDPHYYRVVGTFLDPGFTGLLLALTLVLIFWLLPSSFHLPRETLLLGFSGLITYLALALTYSRASYLAYIVGAGAISFVKRLPRLFLGVILIGLLTLLVLPRPAGEGGKLSRTYTLEARVKNWQQSIEIFKDHPLLGVGFNAYRYAQRDYGFLDETEWPVSHSGAGGDSSFLFVLATTGGLGLMAYLAIWMKAVVEIGRGKRGIVLASLAATLAHSFFLNSLFYPWVMGWWWILLATESN